LLAREGDTQLTLASTKKANNVLGWKAQSTLRRILQVPGNGNRNQKLIETPNTKIIWGFKF
jgi:UDP-glucose 4-epimerase